MAAIESVSEESSTSKEHTIEEEYKDRYNYSISKNKLMTKSYEEKQSKIKSDFRITYATLKTYLSQHENVKPIKYEQVNIAQVLEELIGLTVPEVIYNKLHTVIFGSKIWIQKDAKLLYAYLEQLDELIKIYITSLLLNDLHNITVLKSNSSSIISKLASYAKQIYNYAVTIDEISKENIDNMEIYYRKILATIKIFEDRNVYYAQRAMIIHDLIKRC